ncbi:MAG TPA: M23 family metallopeptidase [Gammaproteobacteria bacterium]|nr:M23 family metallopeptidase [Gammaproteobacteria bacterium]
MTAQVGESKWWRVLRGAWRNVFALATGSLLALLPLASAGPVSSAVALMPYVPQYPHQAHSYQLALTRLPDDETARAWVEAADGALLAPQPARLPLSAAGELAATQPAVGYGFGLPAGRRLTVSVKQVGQERAELFVDLFRATGQRRDRLIGSLPRGEPEPFSIDLLEAGDYVLRIQPPLGASAAYSVDVSAAALLAFPVAGVDGRAIWSGFGAERDGGRRAHRGVDIFAARGTAALAATDGWVTRVETTQRGGNVVWMQPLFGNMRVYYAHLDEQWVEPGEFVLAGQPLGAIGNTGNARTTPPHLHFGVYVRQPGVRGGARDPAEFLR